MTLWSPTTMDFLKMNPKYPSVVYNIVDTVQVWVLGFFFPLSWFIKTVIYVWDMGIPLELPLLRSHHSLSHRPPKVVTAVEDAPCFQRGKSSGVLLSISVCPTCLVLATLSCNPLSLLTQALGSQISQCSFLFSSCPGMAKLTVSFSLRTRSHQVVLFPN